MPALFGARCRPAARSLRPSCPRDMMCHMHTLGRCPAHAAFQDLRPPEQLAACRLTWHQLRRVVQPRPSDLMSNPATCAALRAPRLATAPRRSSAARSSASSHCCRAASAAAASAAARAAASAAAAAASRAASAAAASASDSAAACRAGAACQHAQCASNVAAVLAARMHSGGLHRCGHAAAGAPETPASGIKPHLATPDTSSQMRSWPMSQARGEGPILRARRRMQSWTGAACMNNPP